MSLRESLPPDVELVWDPTPDDYGVKRGDSFCFLKTGLDGIKTFWKEYQYDPRILQRYHILQNRLAQQLNIQDLRLTTGTRYRYYYCRRKYRPFDNKSIFYPLITDAGLRSHMLQGKIPLMMHI